MRYLIVILFVPFLLIPSFSFADEWDDLYEKHLNTLEQSLSKSKLLGCTMAYYLSVDCAESIIGANLKLKSEGDHRLDNSERYKNWIKGLQQGFENMIHSLEVDDLEQVSYYAKEIFKFNCGYERDLFKTLSSVEK